FGRLGNTSVCTPQRSAGLRIEEPRNNEMQETRRDPKADAVLSVGGEGVEEPAQAIRLRDLAIERVGKASSSPATWPAGPQGP
ncbi:MAG: hypothetical protein ACUVX8_18365, partial [Candidatus Zipacnadales bacterium]